MKKYLLLLFVIFIYNNFNYGWVPSVPHGSYLSGSLTPGSIIIFTGAGTIDMNYNGIPSGTTGAHRWLWDFGYDGNSFNEDYRTRSLTITHTFSTVGTYAIAVRYIDDSGTLSSTTYIFNITISSGTIARYYYLKDHLGSVKMTVDETGNVASWNDYDAWGKQMDGRCGNNGGAYDKYKFTGKERDKETNYDYFGARLYDSEIGRWLQVDPLSDNYPGWSPYNYCADNPLKHIDPDGRFFIIDDFIVGLTSGLISGKTFSQSVSQGASYADNCAQLWSSFGRGDVGQIISKLTWEAPQQIVGILSGDIQNMVGNVNSITHSEGATLIETQSKDWGGYTIGSIITAQHGETFQSDLVQHEYGHYMQSQILGPTYLLAIGLPSLLSSAIDPWNHNDGFYTEIWANQLAKKKFGHIPWK